MLNEFAYCPRLFALEWIHGEWDDSDDTVRGRTVHARVDKPSRDGLPDPGEGDEEPRQVRSVYLTSETLRLTAKIDVVEVNGDEVAPCDYKQGKPGPDGTPWEPEQVQVCAQALLLREHGYRVTTAWLWYAGARRKIEVPLTETLIQRTLALRDQALAVAEAGALPPPLLDSPKCARCSLVGICLPDETNTLLGRATQEVRPLVPSRSDARPLVVVLQGGSLRKDHDEIIVRDREQEVGRARIGELDQVVLQGNVSVSTPLLTALAERDIPVSFHSYGGWFLGTFTGMGGRNALWRIAQHRTAADPIRALALARAIVHAKILNQRTLLRRNGDGVAPRTLEILEDHASQALGAPDLDVLMGLEGNAARLYFGSFALMIRQDAREAFHPDGRNRRPPLDPVNALLSFAYASLTRECTLAAHRVGLDPYIGFLHQPRMGRPALALDLMEPFRPVLADSAVLTAINNGEVQENDFQRAPTGVNLTDAGRRAFVRVWQRRLDGEVTHPVFGTKVSYRRILELEARLCARTCIGEVQTWTPFRVR
jgi:CRISPR-associated endonuclease Cas1/CRISPR-associated protein Cas4